MAQEQVAAAKSPPVLPMLPADRARHVANPTKVQADERRLLAGLRDHPSASAGMLARIVNANLSSTKDRLRRFAVRGAIEKDATGGWRLKGEEPRPTIASPN
jgi:hypothetical protein